MRASSVSLVVLLSVACSTAPPEVVDLRTLELSTSVEPQADTIGAIAGQVRFHNPSRRPVTVMLRAPCSLILRAYRLSALGSVPTWDQARRPGGCKSFPFAFSIGSRSSRALPFGPIEAAEILHDSLPVTSYRLTVFIAQSGDPALPGIELTLTTAALKPS
jgi:hypothetical protein